MNTLNTHVIFFYHLSDYNYVEFVWLCSSARACAPREGRCLSVFFTAGSLGPGQCLSHRMNAGQ